MDKRRKGHLEKGQQNRRDWGSEGWDSLFTNRRDIVVFNKGLILISHDDVFNNNLYIYLQKYYSLSVVCLLVLESPTGASLRVCVYVFACVWEAVLAFPSPLGTHSDFNPIRDLLCTNTNLPSGLCTCYLSYRCMLTVVPLPITLWSRTTKQSVALYWWTCWLDHLGSRRSLSVFTGD